MIYLPFYRSYFEYRIIKIITIYFNLKKENEIKHELN
jgi:hypothetical protein